MEQRGYLVIGLLVALLSACTPSGGAAGERQQTNRSGSRRDGRRQRGGANRSRQGQRRRAQAPGQRP